MTENYKEKQEKLCNEFLLEEVNELFSYYI